MPKTKQRRTPKLQHTKTESPKSEPESLIHRALRYTRYPRYFAYAIGLFYVLLLLTNTTFPLLNEKSPTPTPFDWIVTYPPSSPNTLNVPNGSSMILMVKVSAPEAFVDGKEAVVFARGAECDDFVDTVRAVTLGFAGAYWYPITPNGFQVSPYSGVILYPNGTDINGLVWLVPDGNPLDNRYMHLAGEERSIVFRTEGNYPLTLIIDYKNGSAPITYTYPEFSIPVHSSENLWQNKKNTAIEAIAVVGFFFTVLDLIPKVTKKA